MMDEKKRRRREREKGKKAVRKGGREHESVDMIGSGVKEKEDISHVSTKGVTCPPAAPPLGNRVMRV